MILVILIRSDNEMAIAASKSSGHFLVYVQRRKRYKPIIARLRDGTSGMNERPAKMFTGARLKKNVAQSAAALPKTSRRSKKKNGSETAKRITAWLRPIHSWIPAIL